MSLIALLIAAQAAAVQPPAAPPAAVPPPAAPTVGQGVVTTPSGLRIQTLAPGRGAAPQPGGAVLVTYEGRLADGTVFDSATQPTGLPVSALIPGFTEALLMMRVGGRYRFWIPAQLAYGERGAGGGVVPANAELDFTVTLHDVGPLGTPPPAAAE
jgi:FKBP-type peptidyl-prolyl cis-trans isomerase